MTFIEFLEKNYKTTLLFLFLAGIFFWPTIYRYDEMVLSDTKIPVRMNRLTGKTEMFVSEWISEPSSLSEKEKAENVAKAEKEKAISLAKSAETLDVGRYPISNESVIEKEIKTMTGELKITGWEAVKMDDQTYLVQYAYDNGSGTVAWPFEVIPKARLVRNVMQDAALKVKYGFK